MKKASLKPIMENVEFPIAKYERPKDDQLKKMAYDLARVTEQQFIFSAFLGRSGEDIEILPSPHDQLSVLAKAYAYSGITDGPHTAKELADGFFYSACEALDAEFGAGKAR